MSQKHIENPALSYWTTMDEHLKTPLDKGKFVNLEFPFQPDYKAFRKWKNEVNPYRNKIQNGPSLLRKMFKTCILRKIIACGWVIALFSFKSMVLES